MRGRVASFDEHRGLGVIAVDDGAEFGFHCTEIADGTRRVDVGASVEFEVAPRLPGRWEATGVRVVAQ